MDANTLVNEYKKTLDDYNNFYQEYTEFLNSGTDDFVTVDDSQFVGTLLASKMPIESSTICKAQCANFSGCTGATFTKKRCLLQDGEGGLRSLSGATAILKQKQYYLIKLKEKNNGVKASLQRLQNYYDANRDKLTNDLAEKSYAINSYSDNLLMLDNQNRELTNQLQNVMLVDSQVDNSEAEMNHQKAKFQLLGILFLVLIGFILYIAFFSSSSPPSSSPPAAASSSSLTSLITPPQGSA